MGGYAVALVRGHAKEHFITCQVMMRGSAREGEGEPIGSNGKSEWFWGKTKLSLRRQQLNASINFRSHVAAAINKALEHAPYRRRCRLFSAGWLSGFWMAWCGGWVPLVGGAAPWARKCVKFALQHVTLLSQSCSTAARREPWKRKIAVDGKWGENAEKSLVVGRRRSHLLICRTPRHHHPLLHRRSREPASDKKDKN